MEKIIFIVSGYLVLQMCVVWCLYRLLKNPAVVDVSWSLGIMISGLLYLWSSIITLRTFVIGMLLVIWAFRLAGYLWYTRIRNNHLDKRYTELSSQWKINQSLGFFLNFQLQAVFIFIIATPFLFIGKSETLHFSSMDIIGCIAVIVGILGESIADFQLHQFKLQHPGEVCNVGLWAYTRHPNYFFDWITWCGFALISTQYQFGFIGMVSPLLLYVIFTRISGPITERGSIRSRGQQYLDYQSRTSMFFPWAIKGNYTLRE